MQDYSNGLHVEREHGPFLFDVQFQPPLYLALLNNSSGEILRIDQTREEIQYFLLKISLKDGGDLLTYDVNDLAEKQSRLYYYSYLFQQDIFLEDSGENIPCVLFHFEQSDLNKSRTFLLGFEHPVKGEGEDAKLVIRSDQFGSIPIKIKISKHNLPEAGI